MKNRKQLSKTVPFMLIIFVFCAGIIPNSAVALTKTSAKTKAHDQDDFDKKFRAARDSIDKEEWAKAAEKFAKLVADHPNNKSTDAALYWLAFSYKKQKKFMEANQTLERLLKEFADSSWADDARVMKMEFLPSLGGAFSIKNYEKVIVNTINGKISSADNLRILAPNNNLFAAKIPLEREDEIKLAAFQSLLSADTKRAIEILGDVIKPDSNASESLKQQILRVVSNSYRTNPQLTGQLRETLINNLQNQQNTKIVAEIIYTLGKISDDESINYLNKLYAATNDAETKKAIINAFGSNSNGYFYAYNTNNGKIINFNSNVSRKKEFDSLLEIIRAEKDAKLRQLAISKLSQFGNLTENAQVANVFSQIYDSETDENLKLTIIRTLGNIKGDQASKKLLDIAKGEKSDKLKLEAIRSLRTSRDAEVLKFLEQLIN